MGTRYIRALFIPVEGPVQSLLVPYTLEGFQSHVGGSFEHIELPNGFMYVDEEGKLKSWPVNDRATQLWWRHVPKARDHDFIVGPALVFGFDPATGDEVNVPAEYVSELGL